MVAHLDASVPLVGQQVAHQVAEVFDRLGELRVGRGRAVDDVLTEIGVPLTAFFRGHVRKVSGEPLYDAGVGIGELRTNCVYARPEVIFGSVRIRSRLGKDDVGNLT